MDFPKKQAQRLMPLYLLEYSEKLFTNHPNPEDPWGGGSDYTAGQGITITNNEISVDTNVIATKSDIPSLTGYATEEWVQNQGYATSSEIPTNYVTLDTNQTITGLKTIGQTDGTISEVDFSGFTFKLSNKAINHPEADIKIRNGSYDGYQHPIISSTKGLYVNLAKIRLGDDGNNTYGITMPDSSTWETDRVLATTNDIPTKTSELQNDSGFITGVTWNDVTEKPTFATVATTGSYNDLTDKPDFTNYYYINNEIQDGEYITKINGNGLEYSKQWTSNSISIKANCTEMGFDNKPAIVVKTDLNKKAIVSDSIAVYNEPNSYAGIDGERVSIHSPNGYVTSLEDGKLVYTDQNGVRNFNLNSNRSSGNYTLAVLEDIPDSPFLKVDDPQDQMFFSLDGSDYSWSKYVNLSNAPGRMFYVNLSALNPNYGSGLIASYNSNTQALDISLDDNAIPSINPNVPLEPVQTLSTLQVNGVVYGIPSATNYSAGNGIDITNNTISIDNTVALKSEVPSTATSTSTSTVTPATIELVFTYEDNTTQTITLMTGATVSTSTTTTLS